jgi:prolyl-tRNA editing enzyme YbaK/EbsC (Cys-tRNA(Pro) deacylase)
MSSDSAVLTNPSVERVRQALEGAGIDARIVELPGAARTAKAAAEFLGCQVAQIANSLVFRAQASDSAVLVMSSGAQRVDTEKLAALIGEPIGKADADFVRRHTGFAIGGVAPIGHSLKRIFVEKYADLLRITRGTEAALAA